MRSIEELKRSAGEALAYLEAQEDVVEAEVFVAANGHQLTRLHYTSGIPCNGVEEPKSTENFGLGVTIALRAEGEGPARVGFGSEAGDLSIDGVSEALRKAREGAVADPEFYGLPEPSEEGPSLREYHDPALMELGDADLVETGWRVIDRALRAYQRSEELRIAAGGRPLQGMGLILGGDVTILQERMAVASSKLRAVQHDESTIITSAITSMVEAEESKGSGYETGVRLGEFGGTAGEDAAGASIAQIGGVRAPSGEYRVIFGRQAVSDLLNNLILPSLHASTFYMQGSPFQGKAGAAGAAPVADALRRRRSGGGRRGQSDHLRRAAHRAHHAESIAGGSAPCSATGTKRSGCVATRRPNRSSGCRWSSSQVGSHRATASGTGAAGGGTSACGPASPPPTSSSRATSRWPARI